MSLIRYGKITITDVLGFLSARTCTSSSMGGQLEKARSVYAGAEFSDTFNDMHVKSPRPDSFQACDTAESQLVSDVPVLRCVDALARVKNAHVLRDRPSLVRLQKQVPTRGQGELVVQCLRAYEENRGDRSPEKALAAVYLWAHSRAPEAFPSVSHDEEDLAQAFRSGKAPKARQRASDLYGDCYLVLGAFVTWWNLQVYAEAV
jgi:hypothetical protein